MMRRTKALATALGALALAGLVVLAGRWATGEDATAGELPTVTATPTSVRPPPVPEIDKMVNDQQGPVTVTVGESVTYRWVLTNAGDRPMEAFIDDDTHDALDGECPYVDPEYLGGSCEQSAEVVLLTPGPITNTTSVSANGIPPGTSWGYDSDSVTVYVVTPTPPAVGGIAALPEVGGPSLDGSATSGGGDGAAWPLVAAGFGLALAALGVAAVVWGHRRAANER